VEGAEDCENVFKMKELANTLVKKGEFGKAFELLRVLDEFWVKFLDADDGFLVFKEPADLSMSRLVSSSHAYALDAMKDLVFALMETGQLDKAVELLRTRVEVWKRVLGAEHEWTISIKGLVDSLGQK
jgi:hypothetical protein